MARRAPLPTPPSQSNVASYFAAEKRLSNEFVCTIGCEPATSVSLGAGASATGALSLTDGLACGRVAACLVSVGFDAPAFGVAASGRGSPRLASAFGFGGAGGGVAAGVELGNRRAFRNQLRVFGLILFLPLAHGIGDLVGDHIGRALGGSLEHRLLLGIRRLDGIEHVFLLAETDLRLLPRHLEMIVTLLDHFPERHVRIIAVFRHV